MANDIVFSLTGNGQAYGHCALSPHAIANKKYYGVYPLYVKSGKISLIGGFQQIKEKQGIIFATCTKAEGSIVKSTGDFSHNAGLVHFIFDTIDEFKTIIEFIHRTLSFKDEYGDEMLLNRFNINSLELE